MEKIVKLTKYEKSKSGKGGGGCPQLGISFAKFLIPDKKKVLEIQNKYKLLHILSKIHLSVYLE